MEYAQLQLSYTVITAPAAGIVSKRNIQIGQLVQAGSPMFSIVHDSLYITANFKETQMNDIKLNQKVDVSVDAFPDDKIQGTIESVSGATGAKFSLLPPDNATGNFVKVVQRVPVRIRLDVDSTTMLKLRSRYERKGYSSHKKVCDRTHILLFSASNFMAEYGFRRWIITITVIVAALLELIDTTIVNVALPNIMGNLGATLEDANWIVTGYAVANVIILPMSGWLGDRFGRKNYFLTSIIVFTIASFLCGNAHSLTELIAFRLLQGLAGGGLISTAQAILLETWPPAEVGMATALFGLGAVVGPTVGPTIGGFITDNINWQWIFYVNIPVGAIAAFCVSTFVRESQGMVRGNASTGGASCFWRSPWVPYEWSWKRERTRTGLRPGTSPCSPLPP